DALLGRIALHARLLTPEQLVEATDEQARRGGRQRLGEILIEKGFITPAQLQKLLAAQKQVLARQAAKRAEKAAAAAMPEPEPGAARVSAAAARSETRPGPGATRASEAPARAAAAAAPAGAAAAPSATGAQRGAGADAPARGAAASPPARTASAGAAPAASGDAREALHEILREGVAAGVSDVHLHGGAPLRWRRHGVLETQGSEPLTAERGEALL